MEPIDALGVERLPDRGGATLRRLYRVYGEVCSRDSTYRSSPRRRAKPAGDRAHEEELGGIHSAVRYEVEAVLGRDARVVRGILFDKTEGSNWKVPWHQDVTIAVKARVDTAGFGTWSIKEGVQHVQPPASVLEQMLSVRLHLDDCPEENGALRVIPGSHRQGKLEERVIQELAERSEAATCAIGRGGALVMRPLLIHASSASKVPGHRRVIHFDYAAVALPAGLEWLSG